MFVIVFCGAGQSKVIYSCCISDVSY